MNNSVIGLLIICLVPRASRLFADIIVAIEALVVQNCLLRWEDGLPAMARQSLGRLRSGDGWHHTPAEERLLRRSLRLTLRDMRLLHESPDAAIHGRTAALRWADRRNGALV